MKKNIQNSIFLTLILILLAQITYTPYLLSLLYIVMLLSLYLHYQKIEQTYSYKNKSQLTSDMPILEPKFSKILKAGFVVIALCIIYLSYKSFLGVEAGTAVLSVFLFAKSLETQILQRSKRDLIILFNFALFVSASMFLHSQSIWMALCVLCCLLSCLVGLYRVQKTQFELQFIQQQISTSFRSDLGHIIRFIGLAVPFFVVLFLFFPRLPPLWQMPIPSDKGVTGLSDRMSPGEIAELSKSSKLAFRILGDLKKLPPRYELYWRAMALDVYDGETWNSSYLNLQIKPVFPVPPHQSGFEYQYLPAEQNQKWLMALERSIPRDRHLMMHSDDSITHTTQLNSNQPIQMLWLGLNPSVLSNNTKIQYANIDDPRGGGAYRSLSDMQQNILTAYPKRKDPKAQAFAERLFLESHADPKTYIQNLIRWYQQSKFVYTLKPGTLGTHRVDEFLFKTRQGFCEHYASSFTLMMRYVGIPARVVLGYQGGQFSPDQNSWEVRQLDAHAWAEVYIQGQWQRIDPTAMIAPQRIDLGMQDYIQDSPSIFGDSGQADWQYQQFALLKNLRVWSDYLSFQWQHKVVGYDAQTQKSWLRNLGLNSRYAFGFLIIFSIAGLGLLYWLVAKVYLRHQISPVQRRIQRFAKLLTNTQQQQRGESFQHWMERLSVQVTDPKCFKQLIEVFQEIVYLDQNDAKLFKKFENLLKECATELKKNEKNLS